MRTRWTFPSIGTSLPLSFGVAGDNCGTLIGDFVEERENAPKKAWLRASSLQD